MTACCVGSIWTGVPHSLRLTFHVPPHAQTLRSVCSVIAFYSLASPTIWGWVYLYVCRQASLTYLCPKLLLSLYFITLLGFFLLLFIHTQNNRYFRSLYKRAIPHDLWLIGAFDQRGFAPVGHCIQQVAFDHYRRTSLVHRPYTRWAGNDIRFVAIPLWLAKYCLYVMVSISLITPGSVSAFSLFSSVNI